jgi:regulator of nucleoside diphosphate kinase
MKYGKIILEKSEFELIQGLLKRAGHSDQLNEECCNRLRKELQDALVKEEVDMPEDIVRINSIIDVETPSTGGLLFQT